MTSIFNQTLTEVINTRLGSMKLLGMVESREVDINRSIGCYFLRFNNGISLDVALESPYFSAKIDFDDRANHIVLITPTYYRSEDQLERKIERIYNQLDECVYMMTQSQYNFLDSIIILWITQIESLLSKKGKC